jgi:hypothetical protein
VTNTVVAGVSRGKTAGVLLLVISVHGEISGDARTASTTFACRTSTAFMKNLFDKSVSSAGVTKFRRRESTAGRKAKVINKKDGADEAIKFIPLFNQVVFNSEEATGTAQ